MITSAKKTRLDYILDPSIVTKRDNTANKHIYPPPF